MAKYVGYKRPKDTKKTLKRMLHYIGIHKWSMALVAVLICISSFANIFGTYLVKPVVNRYILSGDVPGLIRMLFLMGIMYAAVYTIPTRIFMWSVGLTYFTEAPTKKELLKKVVTHPCIIGIFTGMVLLVSQFQLPGFVNQTVRTVAGANTFCAMLLIGCTLAEIPFKEVFTREVYYYTFIRLFLIPVIVLAGCRLFHIDQLITAVCVILSAMPAASTSVVLAVKYGKDDRLATKIVVFSTVVSLITLPVWCYILTV